MSDKKAFCDYTMGVINEIDTWPAADRCTFLTYIIDYVAQSTGMTIRQAAEVAARIVANEIGETPSVN